MPPSNPATEPWRACYEQLGPRLLLFARQWLHSQADAEDAVQMGFVRFWRKQPDAQPEHYPLLYAAVRCAALDLLRSDDRRNRRETAFHQDALQPEAVLFDASLEQREDAHAIEHALGKLSPEQREVLVLRIWGDLTFAEIATALGDSINTIASRYRYGIDALRKHLKPSIHAPV